ncbi:hypothetical protein HFO56_24270 [Rhizobium laguerreae]|uniref:hypothetical protein n=1 Tax=Rhizobium laguerreae TaxID=1076926 RepID=UPI001C91584D|nr:hypothetical protein [Rhizobium laguerreae]MBY3155446.1 hypothetical protein [Rhizobium laguerreae]
MIIGDAERSRYEAHVALAARHGFSSEMPIKVETTFHLPHSGFGTAASVVEIPVSVEVLVRIMAEGDGVERLGEVSWRDYHGNQDPFRTATYYKTDGVVPGLMRSPSVGRDGFVSPSVTDPFQLAKWLVEQCAQEIKAVAEPTVAKLRKAVQAIVETRVNEGLVSSPLVVGKDGKVTMVREADVPHYIVVPQGAVGKSVDAARCDVMVERPQDFHVLDWQGLGLRFEPWEAEIVGRVMHAYGMKHDSMVPTAIGFSPDAASDLAVANRCSTNALLPHFIKKSMLDLAGSELGKTSTVKAHTAAAYGAVARGEWASEKLDDALASLHELWKYSAPLAEFSRSRGWDCMLSPFEVMKARVEAFPWRRPAAAAVERHKAPAP